MNDFVELIRSERNFVLSIEGWDRLFWRATRVGELTTLSAGVRARLRNDGIGYERERVVGQDMDLYLKWGNHWVPDEGIHRLGGTFLGRVHVVRLAPRPYQLVLRMLSKERIIEASDSEQGAALRALLK